jgi:hypothetical protein
METKFFVDYTVHNMNTGAWAHSSSGSYDDIISAQRKWGSEIDRLFGSADFDFVSVVVTNNYGDALNSLSKDIRVAPEPEPEVAEE